MDYEGPEAEPPEVFDDDDDNDNADEVSAVSQEYDRRQRFRASRYDSAKRYSSPRLNRFDSRSRVSGDSGSGYFAGGSGRVRYDSRRRMIGDSDDDDEESTNSRAYAIPAERVAYVEAMNKDVRMDMPEVMVEESAALMPEKGDGVPTSGRNLNNNDSDAESIQQDNIMVLNILCAQATVQSDKTVSQAPVDQSWDEVREWMAENDAKTVMAAAQQTGESGLTALHFACRNNPPPDIVVELLNAASETAQINDSFGWLPIHYACASGADPAVIHALVEAYPESKTVTDRRNRTPLHFALGEKLAAPETILLLSSTGAAACADEIGMLPLHYACAFGAPEEVLFVLVEAHPDAITVLDSRKRTPLHFALSNAGSKTVPAAVRLLISINPSIVNSIDGSPLPLRVLAEYSLSLRGHSRIKAEKRQLVRRCLEYLLQADPKPTADFFTALQSLPDWLQEYAVVMPEVQKLLNKRIAQRFPAGVLMTDFVILAMTICFYSLAVVDSLDRRFDNDPDNDKVPLTLIAPLYVGGGYFFWREFIQIISLLSLNVFKLWLYDPSNYLNLAFTAIILSWGVVMQQGTGDRDVFRIGASFSVIILWVKLLAYLRSTFIDFAVFVRGVFFVVRRLSAFLVCLSVILLAFAQMFTTIFRQSDYCINQPNNQLSDATILAQTKCDASQLASYCTFWDAFLGVYTMLLGEVDESPFIEYPVALALFVVFMFLVVILLANVLIAIVTDSYRVIQDQKAAIVFWTNRLDFVAEMDAIANGPWTVVFLKIWRCFCQPKPKDEDDEMDDLNAFTMKQFWSNIMELYEEDADALSMNFVAYTFLQIFCALVLIPCWLLLGLLTMGYLWPPQIRNYLFTSAVLAHANEQARNEEIRRTQVDLVKSGLANLKQEFLQELAMDRAQVVKITSQVAERKQEVANEMKEIKKLVMILFETRPTPGL